MKTTGIVRKVGDLGRIVLPKELRTVLNIDECDPIEIFVSGDYVMLRKYEPACILCGESSDVVSYKGKNFCETCLRELGSPDVAAKFQAAPKIPDNDETNNESFIQT